MDWVRATKRNYHAILALGVIWIIVGVIQLDVADGQTFRTLFGVVMLLAGGGAFASAYRMRQHHPEW